MIHPKNPKNKRFMSIPELARALEMTHGAIYSAQNRGNVIREEGGIDLADDINKFFIRRSQAKKGILIQPLYDPDADENIPKEKKKKKIKFVKGKDGKVRIKKAIKEQKAKSIELETKKQKRKVASQKQLAEQTRSGFSNIVTKAEADVARIQAQTTKYNVKIAEDMKLLVARKMVDRLFGQLYSISSNQLLTLGERLAPLLAGICGTTDPDIIMKMKTKIETEISRVLKQVKELTEKEL